MKSGDHHWWLGRKVTLDNKALLFSRLSIQVTHLNFEIKQFKEE